MLVTNLGTMLLGTTTDPGGVKLQVTGNAAITGTLSVTGAIIQPASSPAQITSDQNNYTPTVAGIIRLSSDASRSITGLTFATAQVNGQQTLLVNVGAQNIVLVNESASSTAGNRFHNTTGADITLEPDKQARLWYDATTARWRVTKDN
jgi:hypothetical protein